MSRDREERRNASDEREVAGTERREAQAFGVAGAGPCGAAAGRPAGQAEQRLAATWRGSRMWRRSRGFATINWWATGWWWDAGHGDSSQTVFPAQTLISALERMGITVPQTGANSASNMQVKNMAAVFVVATLPPFSRPGYKMDITVSSAGDARSLEGGILLMTRSTARTGRSTPRLRARWCWAATWPTGGGNTKQSNHPTTARIPGGALVERPVPFDLKQMHVVSVVLNDADFHTAERMAAAIDKALGAKRAHAIDSRRVEIAPGAGRGYGGAAGQGGGRRGGGLSAGAGGGERAHRDGGDRGHGALAAGLDSAWRVEVNVISETRSRSPIPFLGARRRWFSRRRCRPRQAGEPH
jgi:hypothetical protein